MVDSYAKDILSGLTKIPTPNVPSLIVVTGNSQAIFAGTKPGQVIIAGAEYEKGKVFVTGHDCYFNWFKETKDGIKKRFMDNVRKWLTGNETIDSSQIGDFKDSSSKNEDLKKYKIVKWTADFKANKEQQKKLQNYIKDGGALFCGVTTWGFMQIFKKPLKELTMFNFLKDNFGIFLTAGSTGLPTEMDVSQNQAAKSHFDDAIEKIIENPEKAGEYSNTIEAGIEFLKNQGYLKDKKIKELSKKLQEKCKSCNINILPSTKTPIKKEEARIICKLLGRCLVSGPCAKAPSIKEFPGDFESPPELEEVKLSVSTKFWETVSTGYYLPAGVELSVTASSDKLDNWFIRIGAHTDDLGGCGSFVRWPNVLVTKKLSPELNFHSPFGGLVYLCSHGAGSVEITLKNVVETPYIDLTKPETVSDWERRKDAKGLWAELAGKHIILTTPSRFIRHIEDPTKIIKFWDKVISTNHELRGSNPLDSRRERVVNDIQAVAGYMHSGYPVVTHLDCCDPKTDGCIYDIKKMKKNGNWGLFHELGHNMQRGEWTFNGAGEVTVNIFSMHAMQFVTGIDVLDQEWPRQRIKAFKGYFEKQPTYQVWCKKIEMALMTFLQLIKHFGWESMNQFMSDYEKDIKKKTNLPKDNQQKIDQWVIRYSKIVNRNIKPQFEMFGLPVSSSVDGELNGLEPWCPVEEKDGNKFFTKIK